MDAIEKFERNVDAHISRLFDKELTYPTKLFIKLLQIEDRREAGFPMLKDYMDCEMNVVEIKARVGKSVLFRCEIVNGNYKEKMFGDKSYEWKKPFKYFTIDEVTLWKYADVLKAEKFVIKGLGVNFDWSTANFDIDVASGVGVINAEINKWKM